MDKDRVYQISCPNCHHEWSYSKNYYSKKMKQLGNEINDINNQLGQQKRLPKHKRDKEWEINAIKAKNIKLNQLKQLKELRAQYDIAVDLSIDHWFRELVKEEIGEKRYIELREKADEEARAYNTYSTAKTTYTRHDGKSIISVTKI